MEMEYLTLTYADLKDLLRELKAIGAQTVATDRRSGLMGRATWGRLSERYEAFRREGRLPATYEIIYGHAWVGSGPLPAAEAVVKWVPRPSAGRSST